MDTGLKVCDAMTHKPITILPSKTVAECAKLMKEHKIGSLIIAEEENVLGILTENDMVRRCMADGLDPHNVSALELSSSNVVTVSPAVDVFEAMGKMQDYDIRHLPVTNEGKMVGFITVKDILRIQPQLFELLVDKIEVREGERKLQREIFESMQDQTQ